MINKKERTIDVYKNAGARMRLFKTLGARLAVDISCVLSANDTEKLLRALHKIDEVCSRAEDNMFRDHPQLGDEYLDVFYGAVGIGTRNSVDAEIVARAKEAANELFQ